ncbi:AAA family ATPase [Micromonospora sp. RP3T]|uniref:AAA family ATPase n=1 Tax=Micromonospora sp. RP3T TaxID=2135446 RepID=UPI003D744180
MKLISIELHNFRQFVGTQEIAFADADDRNVTLIYGANGGGKTTLLNAFTWVLYGQTSPDFEQKDHLVTDSVWDEAAPGASLDTSVSLSFEHNEIRYQLKRKVITRKEGGRQQPPQTESVRLDSMEPNGAWKTQKAHGERIDQILPPELSQFFFFNGERIERLVHREAYEDIQRAIKTLLGLEQYEVSLKYMPEVSKRLRAELRKLGSNQATSIVSEQDEVRETIERLRDEQQRLTSEVRHHEDEVEVVEAKLRANAPSAQLQKRRDEQERAYAAAKEREARAREIRVGVLTKQAYKIWLAQLLPDVEKEAVELRERGQLPAPLKRQFVDDLLANGECICGTPLRSGEAPHDHVERWRARAGLAEVEGAWQQLQGRAQDIRAAAGDLPEQLRRANVDIATAAEDARQAGAIVSDVAAQILRLPRENGQELERRRAALTQKVQDLKFRSHDIERELKELTERESILSKKLAKVELTDLQSAKIRRRIEVNDLAYATIQRMYDAACEFVRARLDRKIREVFSRISVKSFHPELNSSFELQLWKGEGDDRFPAPKSTGENQLLSLSFIGALVALCKERSAEENTILGHLGGMYPIVMDAPFGNLDTTYREQIARALPAMAPQVVVFTSLAQAEGVVADELEGRVGAKYVVSIRTTKSDVEHESIALDGSSFDYVVPSAEVDHATIERVR